MNPPVDTDFVTLRDDAALLFRMQQSGHRWHVKACPDVVPFEQLQYPRHSHAIAILPPAQAPDRLAAVAQLAGLVIRVERKRHRAARIVLPRLRPPGLSGADTINNRSPLPFRPLPGFEHFLLRCHGRLRDFVLRAMYTLAPERPGS